MATRRERVILDLEDNLSGGLAKAAVASRLLRGELDGLGRDSTRAGDGVDRTARSASKAAPEIDRFSGRLRVLRDVAILLGPALVPLGAATIPVLTGSLAALGAAGGGLGVTILALKGVGDAIKALDDYRLEPTAENLQAIRIEMEKLGPAGAHFVRYLESIEGELRTVQMAAREGLLPGLEDGIDALLDRLPQVRDLVRDLAGGMGGLATSAGQDLAGGDWDAFFSYLETDGRDTLVSFGNAVGDLANGLADLMVAFAPLNRDFADGFEGMAQSFADWAAGLDESESFAEFLDYIQQNAPRALDALGSLVGALTGIVKAMAPVGAVTLPILTRLLDLLAAFANSPLGTPFVAALVGITAYTRAVDMATAAQVRFEAAQKKGFASAQTAAAVAGLVVTLAEYADLMDTAEERTRIWDEALANGTLTLDDLRSGMQSLKDEGTISSVGDLIKTAMDPSAWIKTSLPGFLLWKNEVEDTGDAAALLAGQMEILGDQTKQTGGLAEFFAADIGLTADQLKIAAGDAQAFSGALADLEGWLDKRAAIRGYREAIGQLAKGLKDGFNREDREQIDATAQSIAQVASQIKDKALRADFLANARASLAAMAENAGPKARAEIQKVIAKLDELGLTKPPKPQLDVDTSKADRKLRATKEKFDIFGALASTAELDATAGGFYGVFNPAMSALNSFDGRVATATLRVVKQGVTDAGAGGRGPAAINNDGSVSRVSSRQAMRVDIAGGLGLTVGRSDAAIAEDKAALFLEVLKGQALEVAGSLGSLNQKLKAAEKAVERERRQRDALVARRDDVRNAISSDLSNDLFAVSEASGDPWAAGATPGGVMDPLAAAQDRRDRAKRYIAAIRALKGMGIRGAALQAIISEGLEATEFMASQPQAYVSEFTSTLAEANQYVAQAGNLGANAVVSVAEMNAANAELREANKRLKAIEKAIEKADKNNQDGHQGTQQANQSFQSNIRRGHRRGKAYAG